MAFKFDPTTGTIGETTEQDTFGIPKDVVESDNIPMLDPMGKPVWVGKAKLSAAINAGYRYEPPAAEKERKEAEQFGTLPEAIKTFAESAASTGSLGISREAEIAAGVSPEAMAARERQNPLAAGLGTAAGLIGSLVAPEGIAGAAIKGITAPSRLAMEAGTATSKALAPALAGKFGAGLAGKIAERAATIGAGSAVEGALFGAGQALDEHALGKSHDLAESVLVDAGLGSVLGLGIGGAIGGLSGAAAHFASPKVPAEEILTQAGIVGAEIPKGSVVEDVRYAVAGNDAQKLRDAIGAQNLKQESQEAFFDALNQPKANLREITDAAQELSGLGYKVPVLEEMATDSPIIQKAGEVARNTNTVTGAQRYKTYAEAWNQGTKAAEDALGPVSAESRFELGEKIQKSIIDKFEAKAGPIKELYAEIQPYTMAIGISDKARKSAAKKIMSMAESEGFYKGTDNYKILELAADNIGNIDQLDKLKVLRTAVNGQADRIEYKNVAAIAKVNELFDTLEEKVIKNFAKQMKTDVAKERILSLLDKIDAAKSGYKAFKTEAETLAGNAFGRSRVGGPQSFLDFLEAKKPEDFAKKLFQKDNVRFLKWMQKNFPDELAAMAKFEKGKIAEQFTRKDGQLDAVGAIKHIRKLPKEYVEQLFNKSELRTLDNVDTYLKAFPKTWNPSGTAHMTQFYESLKSPVKMAIAEAQALAATKLLKKDSAINRGIEYLAAVERSAQRTMKRIKSGVSGVFDEIKDSAVPSAVIFGTGSVKKETGLDHEERKKEQKKQDDLHGSLLDLANNPEKMMAALEDKTKDLLTVAPNTTQAMQMTMVRGLTFLASKVPVQPDSAVLSGKFVPSAAEVSKFKRYYAAVQNPFIVLDQMRYGTISLESLEALQTVYPNLYGKISAELMDKLAEHKSKDKHLPYKTKLALSLFLNQDLVNGVKNQELQMTQSVYAQNGMNQPIQNAVKPTAGALKNISASERMRTPMQKTESRGEA